jgi:cell division protein FtsL
MGAVARRIEADPFAHRSSHLHLVTSPPAAAPVPKRASAPKRKRASATAEKPSRTRARTSASVSPATRARVRQEDARARAAFGVFVAVLACAFVLGGARVTLVVRAAEAAITESRVQADIKAQRAEADKLEVDRSSLSTPSRIAGIASASMDMGEPRSVRYISLQDGGAVADTAARSGAAAGATAEIASNDVVGRLFGAVMDLSAGEAQSLLVGDLGLAGSR